MYAPNLMPTKVHQLWMHNNDTNIQTKPSTMQKQPEEDSYQFSNNRYAPPLSSYSSARPGATVYMRPSSSHISSDSIGNELLQNDIEEKLRQLKSIRVLGYSYLAPLGLGKTMETLQKEAEMKRQMEEQYQSDTVTAENLLGEADLGQQQQQQQEQGTQSPSAQQLNNEIDLVRVGRTDTSVSRQTGPPETVDDLQVDLDDEIPDAEEASYNDYEDSDLEADAVTVERQYDREFMVSEQYEIPENGGDSSIQQPETPLNNRVQLQRHQVSLYETDPGSSFVNQSGHLSGFNASGNVISESSFNNADEVSFNGSDLDMTID